MKRLVKKITEAPLRWAPLFILAGSCAAGRPMATEEPAAGGSPPALSLPVHTGGGHLVHEIWLNGQGPYWAILDTGNQGTLIFERVARELALETAPLGQLGGAGPGSIDVMAAHDLTVGLRGDGPELEWTEPRVTVLPDAAALPEFEGRQVDVFLGASLIAKHLVTIDYPAGRLTLQDRRTYTVPEDALVLDLQLTYGFPHMEGEVRARIAGEPGPAVSGQFLLDLGSPLGLQLDHEPTRAAGLLDESALLDPERLVIGQITGIDGVPMDLVVVPTASVHLAGVDLSTTHGFSELHPSPTPSGGPPIPELIGSLGSAPFVKGRLTLDYAGQRAVYEAL